MTDKLEGLSPEERKAVMLMELRLGGMHPDFVQHFANVDPAKFQIKMFSLEQAYAMWIRGDSWKRLVMEPPTLHQRQNPWWSGPK
jgi:hypothetical protein